MIAGVAVLAGALLGQGGEELGVDPVTLLQWREACRLVGEHEPEIWPGYRLGKIPALISRPKLTEVLIRHPRPPLGFVRFAGESALGDEPLFVRRGTTTFSGVTDTTTDLGGVTTLVVTDRAARGDGDDAWNLAVMVHEGFHAWAAAHVKSAAVSELDILEWPDLDARVNAHLELEGRALAAAVRAAAADELEEQAMLFLAERTRRRALMPEAAIRYEDHNEQNEGLASYAEWRAYELWAEHGLPEPLRAALPELDVPAAFRARAEQMINMLGHSARGTFVINGTGYGPGPVRRRGYFFGAAIGKLLDRLADPTSGSQGSPDTHAWKLEAARGRGLTELVAAALGEPSGPELDERADALEGEAGFAALVAAKERATADARRERDRRVAAVLEGEGTLLVIDVAALAPLAPLLPSSWNPFGVLKVDGDRRLFSQSETRFDVGGARIETAADAAIIVDEKRRELRVRSPADPQALAAAISTWTGRYADPAVTIEAPSATLSDPATAPHELRLVLRPAR